MPGEKFHEDLAQFIRQKTLRAEAQADLGNALKKKFGFEFWLEEDFLLIMIQKGLTIGIKYWGMSRSTGPLMKLEWVYVQEKMVNLEDMLEFLPIDFQKFVVFNLDLFSAKEISFRELMAALESFEIK